jgi:hypothetical protein
MANLGAAIRQVRRTRQRLNAPTSENFDRYRREYETILGELADLAGDPAFDELKQWMIETTENRERLPTPTEVRRRALELCNGREIRVPRNSPLRG